MIIAFISSYILENMGFKSVIGFNKYHAFNEYLVVGNSTQCHNGQQYEHHNLSCKEPKASCAHSAGPHLTKNHECTTRVGGWKCTHSPVHCVNCPREPHKSSNPACKVHVKRLIDHHSRGQQAPTSGSNETMTSQ